MRLTHIAAAACVGPETRTGIVCCALASCTHIVQEAEALADTLVSAQVPGMQCDAMHAHVGMHGYVGAGR